MEDCWCRYYFHLFIKPSFTIYILHFPGIWGGENITYDYKTETRYIHNQES
mgnify:FL=1